MRNLWILLKKELKDYLFSPYTYIIAAIFIFVFYFQFVSTIFLDKEATMRFMFTVDTASSLLGWVTLPLMLAIIIPILTMRSWAEEKSKGTLELITTMPVSMYHLIISKFLATFIFVLVLLLFTVFAVIFTLWVGEADYGAIITSYIGVILLSSVFILIGQLISMHNSTQIIALILTLVIVLPLYFLGEPKIINQVGTTVRSWLQFIGFSYHLESFNKGLLDTRDILYFVTIDAIALVLMLKTYLSLKIEGK